jgi:CubicO group peptidase (beta-lactamase class C family)
MSPHTRSLSRRRFLATATGTVAAAAFAARGTDAFVQHTSAAARAKQPATLSDATLSAFEADVEQAMELFRMVGAAVAVVQGNQIVFARGFGERDRERGLPVTPRTRFRIGSVTKSMSSLLVATEVDAGILGWGSRVVDLWPDFRTPDPELTNGLRVRDLMGMATGLAEPDGLTATEFYLGDGATSALDLLRSIASHAVIAPRDTKFYYNDSVYAAAAYLGSLAREMAPEALDAAYAALMQQRVFGPIGMVDATITADPRPLGPDYATPYTPTLLGDLTPLPFIDIGGAAPAGQGMASATDMSRYLITQLQGGVAPDGTRVVSAANLAETHRPGIVLQPGELYNAATQPDTVEQHYCLGWLRDTFDDGRQMLWHAGGIDGFSSQVGFLPADGFGFVVLANMQPEFGAVFALAVQDSLLSRVFGLNQSVLPLLPASAGKLYEQLAAVKAQTSPVTATAIEPYLGGYARGWRLDLASPDTLRLTHDIRAMHLLALPDGDYVGVDGQLVGKRVHFSIDADGVPTMEITGFPPVARLTGS